jgi:hypothetical protein
MERMNEVAIKRPQRTFAAIAPNLLAKTDDGTTSATVIAGATGITSQISAECYKELVVNAHNNFH